MFLLEKTECLFYEGVSPKSWIIWDEVVQKSIFFDKKATWSSII